MERTGDQAGDFWRFACWILQFCNYSAVYFRQRAPTPAEEFRLEKRLPKLSSARHGAATYRRISTQLVSPSTTILSTQTEVPIMGYDRLLWIALVSFVLAVALPTRLTAKQTFHNRERSNGDTYCLCQLVNVAFHYPFCDGGV